MRKTVLFITMAFAMLFSGCKEEEPDGLDSVLVGLWTLQEYTPATKAVMIGQEPILVSVEFFASHRFILVQRIGEAYIESFDGTWSLDGNILSGEYSDKKPWGEKYEIAFSDDDNTLEMKTVTAGEIYVYQREIPKE